VDVQISSGDDGSDQVTFTTLQVTRLTIGERARVLGEIIASDAPTTLANKSRFKGTIWAQEVVVQPGALFLPHDSPTTLPGRQDSDGIDDIETEEQIAEEDLPVTDYALIQSYPNPFNPSMTIKFAMPEAGRAALRIYALTGQLVQTLVDGEMSAGWHSITWNGRDQAGVAVASGMYFYRIEVQEQNGEAVFTKTRRALLMK
jgi:hypothetical protein